MQELNVIPAPDISLPALWQIHHRRGLYTYIYLNTYTIVFMAVKHGSVSHSINTTVGSVYIVYKHAPQVDFLKGTRTSSACPFLNNTTCSGVLFSTMETNERSE